MRSTRRAEANIGVPADKTTTAPNEPQGMTRREVLANSAKLGLGATAIGVLGQSTVGSAMAQPATPHAAPPQLSAAGKARLEAVLKRAAQDITFREALLQNPQQALKGTDLTAAEVKVVSNLHRVRIEEYGIDIRRFRSFLRDNGTKVSALSYSIDYYERLPQLIGLKVVEGNWEQPPAGGPGLIMLTFSPGSATPPPPVGTTVNVSGITPAGYNGTFTVAVANGAQIGYYAPKVGPLTKGGTIQYDSNGNTCF